jgi:hypothetical protein
MVIVLLTALGLGLKDTLIDVGDATSTMGATGVASFAEPAITEIDGDALMLLSAPDTVDFSIVAHVATPIVDVAVAPGPALLVEPYVIVKLLPDVSVTPVALMVDPLTATVPVLATVKPGVLAVVVGVDQPLGTVTSTSPSNVPPTPAV